MSWTPICDIRNQLFLSSFLLSSVHPAKKIVSILKVGGGKHAKLTMKIMSLRLYTYM